MPEAVPQQVITAWHAAGESDQQQRLRLTFDWLQDRFQLRLFLDEKTANANPSSKLLLTSLEGTPDDRWPASPPLQSLAIESRGEHSVALAVGMAGKAHWSASVETLDDPLALHLDYACRLTEEPQFLGSTFELQPQLQLDQNFYLENLIGGQQEVVDHLLRITSDPPLAANSVWTARWRFTLRFV